MAHTIIIHRGAERDIEGVVARIAQHISARSASRWHDQILCSIRTLQDKPERCPLTDEATELGFDLRFLLHGRRRQIYRVLFTIEGNVVHILRVCHAAQDALRNDDF